LFSSSWLLLLLLLAFTTFAIISNNSERGAFFKLSPHDPLLHRALPCPTPQNVRHRQTLFS
jgi:hypothetical protein